MYQVNREKRVVDYLYGKLTLENKYYILWLVFGNFIIVLVIREMI